MMFDGFDIEELKYDADQCIEVGKTLLPMVAIFADKFKPLAVEVLKVLLKECADIYQDLEPELARLSTIEAKIKRRNMDNYKAAGFTTQQAFLLVLASLKPFDLSNTLSKVIPNSSRSGK